MSLEFSGKAALITGAAGGIGRATAELLHARGAGIILGGRDPARLAEIAATLPGSRILPLDLIDPARIDATMAQCGPIDILAHVAGIYPSALVAQMSDAFLDEMIAVNMAGTIRLCRAVTRLMLGQGGGVIVNVSSLAAQKTTPGLSAYAATKAAIEAFSKSLAHEVAPLIRVNVVAPGPTLTESVRALVLSDTTGAVASVTRDIPLGRMADPSEIAEAIAFLASPRASYITGAVLHVNGGALMA